MNSVNRSPSEHNRADIDFEGSQDVADYVVTGVRVEKWTSSLASSVARGVAQDRLHPGRRDPPEAKKHDILNVDVAEADGPFLVAQSREGKVVILEASARG